MEADEVEAQLRRGQEKRTLPLEGAAEAALELFGGRSLNAEQRRARRRAGAPAHLPPARGPRPLRRPPPGPAAEVAHPWTIPNAIGFARIALIPVFLVIAVLGRRPLGLAFALAFIAWTDYLDGMAAHPASTAWGRCSTRSPTGC